jgi:tetratricopeptide (TPR) repeat protein
LGIRYSAFDTGTAKEVFESTKANCLGYTLLYVALARHLGLNAEVNQVSVPPVWNMNEEKSYFLMRHVNAKVVIRRKSWSFVREVSSVSDLGDVIVDLEMSRFRANYPQESLDEQSVEALFYNNRAMELASQGDTKNAFLYLRRAIEANNKQSFIWSNLGSFYRKRGHLSLAETIYLHALSINKKDLTVLHNLAGLYVQLGDHEKSELYTRKVQRYRNANPYYLYQEAVKAKEAGDIEKAKLLIARALKKETGDDRLYLLSAELSEIEGNLLQAAYMRKKAESLKM